MISVGGVAVIGGTSGLPAGGGTQSGTLASRAASPAVGAQFYATDADLALACAVAGAWRVEGVGPLAVTRGPFAASTNLQSAAGTAIVTGGPGTTLAWGGHVTSLPGATIKVIAECHTDVVTQGSDSGWALAVSANTTNRLALLHQGMSSGAFIDLGDVVTGAFAVAISVSTTAIRWSIKGGSVGSASITGTYVVPNASTARLTIGGNYNGLLPPTTMHASWLASWGATLSDAALQAISGAYASYTPGEAGAVPVAAWLAARTPQGAAYAQTVGSQGGQLLVTSTLGWTAR